MDELTVIVLAAGAGTRMRSKTMKVLHEVGGRSMVGHVLAAMVQTAIATAVVLVIAVLLGYRPDAGAAQWLGALTVLALLAPLLILTVRCSVPVALVALELASTLVTLVLVLLAAGTNREPLMDLALVSAFLSFAGSLAFARFLERWI